MARLAQAVGLGPFFLSRFSALSELISRSTVAHLSNIVRRLRHEFPYWVLTPDSKSRSY